MERTGVLLSFVCVPYTTKYIGEWTGDQDCADFSAVFDLVNNLGISGSVVSIY